LGKATWSIEIEASPEKVFDFVTSEKINDVYKDFAEGKWTSERPIGLGSTAHYVGTSRYNKGEEWNAEVTEFTKNKSMTMFLKGANKHSNDQTNYYVFEPTTKGTKLTMSMEYKLPYSILGKLIDVLYAKRVLERESTKMAENLKKALEA
jgi:uncharacterized membrane protein